MTTFASLVDTIYEVFGSEAWKAEKVKAFPWSYQGDVGKVPFLRIKILPGRPEFVAFGFRKQLTGMLIISIFTDTNSGDTQLAAISDTLDKYFQGKTLSNNLQFGVSTLNVIGAESQNTSLYRGDYSIQFNFYGSNA